MFEAELLTETKTQDPTMDVAISVTDGHFTWDAPPPQPETGKKKGGKKEAPGKDVAETKDKEKIFTLRDVNMDMAKGRLTAIVGRSLKWSVFRVHFGLNKSAQARWVLARRLYWKHSSGRCVVLRERCGSTALWLTAHRQHGYR